MIVHSICQHTAAPIERLENTLENTLDDNFELVTLLAVRIQAYLLLHVRTTTTMALATSTQNIHLVWVHEWGGVGTRRELGGGGERVFTQVLVSFHQHEVDIKCTLTRTKCVYRTPLTINACRDLSSKREAMLAHQ